MINTEQSWRKMAQFSNWFVMFEYIEITSMRDDGIRSTECIRQLEVTWSIWSDLWIWSKLWDEALQCWNFFPATCMWFHFDPLMNCYKWNRVWAFEHAHRWTRTFIAWSVWTKTRVITLSINMIYIMRVIISVEIEAEQIFWPTQTIFNTSNWSKINDKKHLWKIIIINAFIVAIYRCSTNEIIARFN